MQNQHKTIKFDQVEQNYSLFEQDEDSFDGDFVDEVDYDDVQDYEVPVHPLYALDLTEQHDLTEPPVLTQEEIENANKYKQTQKQLENEQKERLEQERLMKEQKEYDEKNTTITNWMVTHPDTQIPRPKLIDGVLVHTASLGFRWKIYVQEHLAEVDRLRQEETERRALENKMLCQQALKTAEENAQKLLKIQKQAQQQRAKQKRQEWVQKQQRQQNKKKNMTQQKEIAKKAVEERDRDVVAPRTITIIPKQPDDKYVCESKMPEIEDADEEFPCLVGRPVKFDLTQLPTAKKPKTKKPKAPLSPKKVKKTVEKVEQKVEQKEMNEENDSDFATMMIKLQTPQQTIKPQITRPAKHQPVKPKNVQPNVQQQAVQQRLKTRLCHSVTKGGRCPHGANCMFAHTIEELQFPQCHFGEKCYRQKSTDNPCGFIHPNEKSQDVCCRLGYAINLIQQEQPKPKQPIQSAKPVHSEKTYTAPPAPWTKPTERKRKPRWDVC